MTPIVSASIGTNKYDWLSEEYLFLLLLLLLIIIIIIIIIICLPAQSL